MTVMVDGICLSEADIDRVRRKIDRHGPMFGRLRRCHLWTGKPNPKGYGVVDFRRDGKSVLRRAHRVVWVLSGRTLTPGLVLDHLCLCRLCVNPRHLEEVDPRENIRRGSGRWRYTGLVHPNSRKTHCPYGHDYAVHGTVNKQGSRYCKACTRKGGPKWKGRRLGPTVSAEVHWDPNPGGG